MTNEEIIELLKEYRNHLLKLRSHQQYNYQETKTFLNKNRVAVQNILTETGTLHYISIAPPPMIGGYMMNNINPFDIIFDPPYDMDISGHLSNVIEQAIGVIEADSEFASKITAKPMEEKAYDIWALIHPTIVELSKKRMKDGFYADAVEAACKSLNARVREMVMDQTGEELDGAGLMRKAFSPGNPIIKLARVESKSGHDAQQGYKDIFAGVMTGIRNPKAHDNESITKEDAFRKLVLISLLMSKIDERIITD